LDNDRGYVAKSKKNLFVALVMATHFPQALAMVVVTTLASALFGQHGLELLFVVIATAAGQASIGWANDYIDAKTDQALNRTHKPAVRYSLDPQTLRTPILVAVVVMVPFSVLAAGWIGGLAHILAVASAQVYNLFLSRTIWSWIPYAVSFVLLTVFITQSSWGKLWPSWQFVCIAACVGIIAHVFNALPDIRIDKEAKLGGLVVSLGTTKALSVLVVLLIVLLTLLVQVVSQYFLSS
jgi:4-hydroxybenzoate polyprenyltransferase